MKKIRIKDWEKYAIEFLSVFIAVLSAFALNNWNENRRADMSENKILTEIENGLEKDIEDIRQNKQGHISGINACYYFRDALADKKVKQDSLMVHYYYLTRDFISIQNTAGYETLKSRGLELIKNDSLRLKIISLYEYDYSILRKLEEEYSEMQFQESYFNEINKILASSFKFNNNNKIIGIELPLQVTDNQKKTLLLYLWKIQRNRNYILEYYAQIESKVVDVQQNIHKEIKP